MIRVQKGFFMSKQIFRNIRIAFIAILFGLTTAQHAMADDVSFSDQVNVGDQILELVGDDLLVYLIWDAYQMALYLPQNVSPTTLLNDVPKSIVIHYLVDIDADEFGPAGDKILADNISPERMAALRPKLDQINAAYQAVEEGDRYQLTYLPDFGTTLAKNGVDLVTIAGADFANAYFQIWFGAEPVDEDLRDNLLAGKRYTQR